MVTAFTASSSTRPFFAHLATLGLAAGMAAAPCAGCLGIDGASQKAALKSYVTDWRDEVIYQVLVDRFADGDPNNDYNIRPGALARFQGGDWRGIEQHVDYLKTLGVTTLWISPVVRNVETDADIDSYHGYWAQDLTQVNPHFGNLEDLRHFTATMHANGIKVVLDIVTNHMGQAFFYDMNLNGKPDIQESGTGQPLPGDGPIPPKGFPDATYHSSEIFRSTEYDPDYDARGVQSVTSLGRSGQAPIIFIDDPTINRIPPQPGILGMRDGYHGRGRIVDYNIREQVLFGDFPGGLKDVATENPVVRDTMVDAYARWVEKANFDGFRIDTIKHVEDDFWPYFATKVRSRLYAQGKTNFFMFGEAFDGDDKLLGSYTQPGALDSVFYFSQHYSVFRDIFMYAYDKTQQKGTNQIAALWGMKAAHYNTVAQPWGANVPPIKGLVNFIDNHDVARFLFISQGDTAALRNALTFLFMEDGIPCVYYGTEQGFSGGNDPANREVLWTTGFDTTGDLFRFTAKLTRLRRTYAALRKGDTSVRFSTTHVGDEGDAGIFAFERTGGDAGAGYALVVVNSNARHTSAADGAGGSLNVSAPAGTVLVDVLGVPPAEYTVEAGGTLSHLAVPAQSTLVLVPKDQVVSN